MASLNCEGEVKVSDTDTFSRIPPTLITTSFSRDTFDGQFLGLWACQLSMGERPPPGADILCLTAPGNFGTPLGGTQPQASTPAVKEVPFSGSKLGTPIGQLSDTLSTPSKYLVFEFSISPSCFGI